MDRGVSKSLLCVFLVLNRPVVPVLPPKFQLLNTFMFN